MRNQRGKTSGQRLSKVIVSLTLALMLLCGNFSTTAPAILNALALEVVAETPAAPAEQPQEPAPQPEAETPVEQPSDPVPQGEIVPEGKPEGEAKPATPTTDEPTKTDAPETPAAGTPVADAPASETPATESAETGAPETPAAGTPAADAPATGEPTETDTPAKDTPATDTPATDEPTKTDTPATDTPATDAPATDTPATDAPATDIPATDVPVDERSPLQHAIEDENGAYVDVQSGKVYESQNLNKLMGVLDGGLAFATEYTVREDGEDSVRVIFRTGDDSLLIGYLPASRATELGRQQTIDDLTGNGVTFLFNENPDLPLSVMGYTPDVKPDQPEEPAQPEDPAQPEEPQEFIPILEDMEPWVAATTHNSVNLRKEPSTESALMVQLDRGTRMTVRGQLFDADGALWYYVTYHLNPYYVMADYVDVAESLEQPPETPAEPDTPAEVEVPVEPSQPDENIGGFASVPFEGDLPVSVTANGDDYYTHTAADGALTLLVYGSVNGGTPNFYAVDENDRAITSAPFAMEIPPLELTVEPDAELSVPFAQTAYEGDLPAGIAANEDGSFTYTAADGTLTLLAYGSVNGGDPAFYPVDENGDVNTSAPFVMEIPPLELTVEPDAELPDPFVQMEYEGEPVAGITANGDGYYTHTTENGAQTLLVYGSANGGEPAFFVVDENLMIDLTAPFVLAQTPAAPEATDGIIFTPIAPDVSLVPEYYQLVSAPASTEEAEPAPAENAEPIPSAFLNWLLPRASAEEAASNNQATSPTIYSFTVDNGDGAQTTYYRIYGALKVEATGEVITMGFFACDSSGTFDTQNYQLVDPQDDFRLMNLNDTVSAIATMLKALPTLAEVETLAASNDAGSAATLASTEELTANISLQLAVLREGKNEEEIAALNQRLNTEAPSGLDNLAALTAYFVQRHAQQLADVQAAIDALPMVETVQAMDVTAEDYAQRFAVVETDTAAAQTLLTAYKATLTEEALANLEALLGTPEAAESNGETHANGETPAEGAPAEGATPTEAASQPTRLAKLNDLTAYFADQRYIARVTPWLTMATDLLNQYTPEAISALAFDQPDEEWSVPENDYFLAKSADYAVREALQTLLADMTDAEQARFAADPAVQDVLTKLGLLFVAFEGETEPYKEIPHIIKAIDAMPDPAYVGLLLELLSGDESADTPTLLDMPTEAGTSPETVTEGTPATGNGETAAPADDAQPAQPDVQQIAALLTEMGVTFSAENASDTLNAANDLLINTYGSLGDVDSRTTFLSFDQADPDAYLTGKLGVQEGAETTRLEKYNALLGIMQGISGIQTLADTADLLTADWVYVSKLEVTKIVDGVAPFDTNPSSTAADYSDRPGNDAGDSNKLVRTFDDITYNMTITTALHDDAAVNAVKNGYLYYEFTIPGYSAKEATFNTTAMSWIGTPVADLASVPAGQSGYILTEGASSVTIRGKYYCTPSGSSVNAFPGRVLPYATVRVNAAKNGDEIQPTFKWWADYNTETGNCPTHGVEEPKSVTADKVKVTAQMRLNVQLVSEENAQGVKTFDFSTTGNDTALNKDSGQIKGRITAFGIGLFIYNDNGDTLRGIEIPSGPITLSVDLSSSFVKESDPDNPIPLDTMDTYRPLVWAYSANAYNNGTNNDRKITDVCNNNVNYIGLLPYNSGNNRTTACYAGGNWTVSQNGRTLSITVKDYVINYNRFPSGNIYDDEKYYPIGEEVKNIGCISAGGIYCVIPFGEGANYLPTKYAEDGTVSFTVKDVGLSATSIGGTQLPSAPTSSANQTKNDDDVNVRTIFLTKPGTIDTQIFYSTQNSAQWLDIKGGTEYRTNGKDWASSGEAKAIFGDVYNIPNGDAYNAMRAGNTLIKFDDEAIEVTGVVRWGSEYYKRYTALYAAKKDGNGWISDSEMAAASETDLVYYGSLAELKAAGKTCVAVLYEGRDLKPEYEMVREDVACKVQFNFKSGIEGNVYQTCISATYWCNPEFQAAGGVIPSRLEVQNSGGTVTMPEATGSFVRPYAKATYNDSGYAGGDTGGYRNGDSVYIVPWQATITKGIAQQENSADKKIYITSSGERVVDFKMQPKLSSGMTIPASGITPGDRGRTTVTITDTLPAKITYIPGSTYFGGTNDYVQNAEPGRQGTVTGGVNTEPTAVKNPNGTTTLTWLLENVPVNVTMPTIYYSCDIGQEGAANDVVDNEQFTNTVQIRAEGDKRDITVANKNLATAGFSISSVGAAAISKIPISRYNEPGDAFGWTMNAGNNGGSVISNAMVLDTMPENGYQGSSFTTPLKVASWKINTTKLINFATWHAFYTVSTGANRTKVNQYTATDILNAPHQSTVDGNTITWVPITIAGDGTVNVPQTVSPTALIVIGNLDIGAACETILMVDALTGSTKADDIYVNQLSSGDTTTTSRSYVIRRTLDGVAWLDANYNGQRNSDEAQLAGVTVTLYKLKDGQNPALEASYTPVLVNGTPATVTTGATNNAMNLSDGSLTTYAPDAGDTGRYKFIGLNAGTYAVKFSGTTIAPYRASPVDTGADTLDSDGKPTYTGATLTSTFIPNIVMPTKENMATFQYDDHYYDSGFDVYRIEFTVGKAVSGNAADRTKTFEFTLTFANKADFAGQSFAYVGASTVTGVAAPDNGTLTLDADGKGTIRLKHGQTITIKGVPVSTTNTITVTETSPVSEGYTATYTYTVGATAKATDVKNNETTPFKTSDSAISAGSAEAQKAAFTNTRTITVPTGILLDIWPYLLIVAVAMGGAAWLLISKRKSNHKKHNSDNWN